MEECCVVCVAYISETEKSTIRTTDRAHVVKGAHSS